MNRTLKPFDDGKGNGFTHPDKALKELLEYKPEKQEKPKVETSSVLDIAHSHFNVRETDARFSITIPYAGGIYFAEWSKELFDGEYYRTQESWLRVAEQGNWKIASAPLYYATFAVLHAHRDHPDERKRALVEKMRQMFRQDLEKRVITDTKVMYAKKGKDNVVHDRGSPLERTVIVKIAVDSIEDEINALLETKNLEEIKEVYRWISGKETFAVRRSPPDETLVAAVSLNEFNVYIAPIEYKGIARPAQLYNVITANLPENES